MFMSVSSPLAEECQTWLEDQSGKRQPINGSCSLGRGSSNQVPVPDDRASRRHALIQTERENEFWLLDFGSRNGTYLNDQRITRPTRLRDGDQIKIGHAKFVFRHSRDSEGNSGTVYSDRTVSDIRPAKCWLVVADIIGSTELVKVLPPGELAALTGQWVASCKQTIEAQGGRINQFLGDGFFAYWRDRPNLEQGVASALKTLKNLQEDGRPPFRLAVHVGDVAIGGVSVGEEERISGSEVHFVFRSEDLSSKLSETRVMSEKAHARLSSLMETHPLGNHPLGGFDGEFAFHAF
ncbi:MAG TPA: FHA domain-containing protein [Verrucomicrobiae bacterium]|jgi:adenylate cyclase|nr:FHA domain-containing protein [Verrucomicrobiae bacterium]